MEFYRKGHDLGSTIATSNIGAAYAQGLGVELDYAKSYEFASLAAEQGDVQSLHNLGVHYRDGLHVKANQTVAFLLFQDAQQLGYPKAGQQVADFMLNEGTRFSNPVGALAYCKWAELVATDAQRQELFMNCDEVAEVLTPEERAAAAEWAEQMAE